MVHKCIYAGVSVSSVSVFVSVPVTDSVCVNLCLLSSLAGALWTLSCLVNPVRLSTGHLTDNVSPKDLLAPGALSSPASI